MKYTNLIINGDVNIESLVSNKKYLRPATIMMTIPVAIFGLALLPAAGMDLGRYIKAVASLTDDKNVRKEACKLLNEML